MTLKRLMAVSASAGAEVSPQQVAPWLVLCPVGTAEVHVQHGWRAVRQLPAGTPVALIDSRPASRSRLRRIARKLPMTVERELIVLPTAGHPIVVMDDTSDAVRHFWRSVAAVPPGVAAASLPTTLLLRAARTLPWTWTGAIAPGRVLLGTRP
jgi:hypothetical protein